MKHTYVCTCIQSEYPLYTVTMVGVFQWFLFLSVVCALVCENSGVLNSTSCSCDCMASYTGPTCRGMFPVLLCCHNGPHSIFVCCCYFVVYVYY